MKRFYVTDGHAALVFLQGNYKRVLTSGKYWLKRNETTELYNMTHVFCPKVPSKILLEDETLANMLKVVEVPDNCITIRFDDGNYKSILTPGKYMFWKSLIDYTFMEIDLSQMEISETFDKNLLQQLELSGQVRKFSIEPYQKGLLYFDGKFIKILETGEYFFWKNPTKIVVAKLDIRQQQIEVSGQEILTKDKAALRINFFAQYKVTDIIKALNENKEYDKQLYIGLQLALREYVGMHTFDEILENKDAISSYVMDAFSKKAVNLGLELIDCGVRDIILPGDVKEIMNQVLIAQKQSQANAITRREETASTRSLLNTAKLLEENEMLFRLKEMEYVEKIADKINTISLSGGGQLVDQLKQIFSPNQ